MNFVYSMLARAARLEPVSENNPKQNKNELQITAFFSMLELAKAKQNKKETINKWESKFCED